MKERVQCTVTAGIAIVGAGVVALTPIAAPASTETVRASDVSVNLMASTSPVRSVVGGVGGSAARLVESLVLAGFTPFEIAQAVANNDVDDLYSVIENTNDAPLYIADPTIFGINDALPEPLGGGADGDPRVRADSAVLAFRVNVLYAARQQLRAIAQDALGIGSGAGAGVTTALAATSPVGDPVATAVRLGEGISQSAVRLVQSSAAGLFGPLAAADALAHNDREALFGVIESYVDAPLYIADPTIFAIDDVLAAPIGQDPSIKPTKMNGSVVTQLPANVLIAARDAIKPGIKNVIGYPAPDAETFVVKDVADEAPAVEVLPEPEKKSGPAPAVKTKPGAHRAPTARPVRTAIKNVQTAVTNLAKKPAEKKKDSPASTSETD
jgi:hypothetical protein